MTKRRKIIKEMFDAVEKGTAFTVYGKDDEPMAMVLPWADWQRMNEALESLHRQEVQQKSSGGTGGDTGSSGYIKGEAHPT